MTVAELQAKLAALVAEDPAIAGLNVICVDDGDHYDSETVEVRDVYRPRNWDHAKDRPLPPAVPERSLVIE